MKKSVINAVLAVCVLGLAYACYESIHSDIEFKNEREARQKLVIERLMQIRDAEEQYKITFGYYCGTIDSLIDYVKTGMTVDKVIKEGELSDEQLEAGMTEREAIQKGIIRRDTMWVTAAEKLGITNPDSMKYVPVGRVADGTFTTVKAVYSTDIDTIYQGIIELRKRDEYNMKTESWENLVEFRARMDDYLDGLSEKKIKNYKSELKKLGRNHAELMFDNEDDTEGEWYGLRMGDLKDTSNKMAGNWE